MSGKGLSYGLNITKKQSLSSRRPLGKRELVFDEDDDSRSENINEGEVNIEEIGEIGSPDTLSRNGLVQNESKTQARSNSRNGVADKKRVPISAYGDLSTSFTSKKHAETAEVIDASIYDYDAVYESLKPKKKTTAKDQERKPKYMGNLLAAATVRKRDAAIAEEKRLAREREAEGEEFADKEKFVTSAYKKQQEEARRLAEEEQLREAKEQKENKGAGMTDFFKSVLERGEQKHAEVIRAVGERVKAGPQVEETDVDEEKIEAELAREIHEKTGVAIAVNDEGQVVDKRQLLKGGLNILPKPRASASTSASRGDSTVSNRSHGSAFAESGRGKQAMRERQSRMLETQLEQATKRALEREEEERQMIERAAKSRKTEGEIMNAKERYLARKREAEEAKKKDESRQ
jgi:coiled-coil domain-containing protein 55